MCKLPVTLGGGMTMQYGGGGGDGVVVGGGIDGAVVEDAEFDVSADAGVDVVGVDAPTGVDDAADVGGADAAWWGTKYCACSQVLYHFCSICCGE